MVIEKVPYVSFDPETGDEITAYEEVKSEKMVKVDEKEELVDVDNFAMIQKDIFGLAYSKIREELEKLFPDNDIIVD